MPRRRAFRRDLGIGASFRLDGTMPFGSCHRLDDIRRQSASEKFGLRYTIEHCTEGTSSRPGWRKKGLCRRGADGIESKIELRNKSGIRP